MAGSARVGTITIGMRAGVAGLRKDMRAATAEVNRFSEVVTGMRNAAVAASAAIAGFFAVRKVAGFFADSAMAASDLHEQVSAAVETFHDYAGIVHDAADQMAKDHGTVKVEFLEAANTLGSIFQATGYGREQAAEASVEYTKLAADLAGFANIRFEEAMDKITSGLLGTAKPLRSVGVLLSEADVATEAYASGIAKFGERLTEAQKVQARGILITRQLADAQGDLERTSDTVASRVEAISGRIKNFKADAGTAFTSVTQALTGGVNLALAKLFDLWAENSGGIKEWADNAVKEGGAVAKAIEWVGTAVGFVADTIHVGKVAFLGFQLTTSKVVAGVLGSLSLLGKGLAAVVNLIPGVEVSWGQGLEAMARAVDETAEEQRAKMEKEWNKPLPSTGIKSFFDDIKTGAQAAAEATEESAGSMERLSEAQLKLASGVADLTDKLQEQIDTFGMSSTEIELHKLAAEGASEADLAQARALSAQLKEMQASAKARDDLQAEAKALFQATRTDAEKQAAEVAKARQLLEAGLIDQDTFDRAVAGKVETGSAKATGAAALEAGSAEARSALLAFSRRDSQKDPIEDVKRNTGKQVEGQNRTNSLLGSILGALSGGPSAAGDLIPAA